MTIEHRYCARHPMTIDVQIRYRKRHFRSAKGRNLSHLGMYLEVRNLTLPTGTMVTLGIHGVTQDWLFPAIVVHRDSSGIGVMFREPQHVLVESLAGSEVPPPHPFSPSTSAGHSLNA